MNERRGRTQSATARSQASSYVSRSRRRSTEEDDGEGTRGGTTPSLGVSAFAGTASRDFSFWLHREAEKAVAEDKRSSKMRTLELFCVSLGAMAIVTRTFFQCDVTIIMLTCSGSAWFFLSRDSTPRFFIATNAFFSLVQLIYCEPIHSSIASDGLSSAERFYSVAATPLFRSMSAFVGIGFVYLLSWSIHMYFHQDHESVLDCVCAMIAQNLLRVGVLLWDSCDTLEFFQDRSDKSLVIEKALNGLVVTATLLYLGHITLINEGFRIQDIRRIGFERLRVRWPALLEFAAGIVVFLTIDSDDESRKGSCKWYLYNTLCVAIVPRHASRWPILHRRIACFLAAAAAVLAFPLTPTTWIRALHGAFFIANAVDLAPLV